MRPSLGELERVVMDRLWDAGRPLLVREVADALADRSLAYTTVLTVLDRLARKGFARRERDGRAWRYAPAASRDQYVATLMLDALDLTGDRDAALTRFARSVPAPDAEALGRALADLDRPPDQP
ncbi:BlaI/MecI/CopY family transcriptional regulator [Pseudonocardia acaciae]|uniref:BlaI/MecI/CopY family transcriptional regulator n=1 Tax=Pseudonocardia acaciae TaxID=551276 RepID=UPI00056A8E5E|nr:BlaI/MecI/CopY family transcriptional regulator [Pseudonocardia acaciae]